MKKRTYLASVLAMSIMAFSCSSDDNSVTDEFIEVNGNVQEKKMSAISVTSAQDPSENQNISISYNADGILTTISDGFDTTIFVYDNNQLTDITGPGDNLDIEELYESPYDAFETGDVLEYDGNGNPKIIEFYEEEYNFSTGMFEDKTYTAEVSYDTSHNPYFYTLQAGGIIEVLDEVQLNFGAMPTAPEIVQARLLFPANNPSQLIYKNENGETVHTINANYVYDSENYPTSATVSSIDVLNGAQSTYAATFSYLN